MQIDRSFFETHFEMIAEVFAQFNVVTCFVDFPEHEYDHVVIYVDFPPQQGRLFYQLHESLRQVFIDESVVANFNLIDTALIIAGQRMRPPETAVNFFDFDPAKKIRLSSSPSVTMFSAPQGAVSSAEHVVTDALSAPSTPKEGRKSFYSSNQETPTRPSYKASNGAYGSSVSRSLEFK